MVSPKDPNPEDRGIAVKYGHKDYNHFVNNFGFVLLCFPYCKLFIFVNFAVNYRFCQFNNDFVSGAISNTTCSIMSN